jgi:hypothetical protein
VLILVVWLYGTLALAERRSGYIIMLLGAILGTLVAVAHMRGAGLVGGRIANSPGSRVPGGSSVRAVEAGAGRASRRAARSPA